MSNDKPFLNHHKDKLADSTLLLKAYYYIGKKYLKVDDEKKKKSHGNPPLVLMVYKHVTVSEADSIAYQLEMIHGYRQLKNNANQNRGEVRRTSLEKSK